MIKEANEINLGFPELSVLSKVHKDAEDWVDRASIAMRSKISVRELEKLVDMGQKLPLGLTATLDKLTTRYEQACTWIARLKIEVPSPFENIDSTGSNLDVNHLYDWLKAMLHSLKDENKEKVDELINLAAEGSRLSVDIDLLKLLQIAIDSKNWSTKAENWLPGAGANFKKGKIDDLIEHADEAQMIVEKVETLTNGEKEWSLKYEKEIREIVEKASSWHEKVNLNRSTCSKFLCYVQFSHNFSFVFKV